MKFTQKPAALAVLLALAILAGMARTSPAHAKLESDPNRPQIAGWGEVPGSTSPVIGIDTDGDLLPGRNNRSDLGESTRTYKTIYGNDLNIVNGIAQVHETYVALASASFQGLRPGGFSPSTAALINGGSTYTDSLITQSSGAPRNITVWVSSNASGLQGGGVSTTTYSGYVFLRGIDSKGNNETEFIYFSTNPVVWSTQTYSNTDASRGFLNYVGIGTVAWSTVSSMTIVVTSMTAAYGLNTATQCVNVSWGQKIGLSLNITTTTQVYKVVEDGGRDRTSLTANTALAIDPINDTIIFSVLPNGINDKQVWIKQTTTFSP